MKPLAESFFQWDKNPAAYETARARLAALILSTSNRVKTASTIVRFQQGRHKVTVAFIDDHSHPPDEDRNLDVDKVLIARAEEKDGVTFLTAPPTTAVVQRGRGSIVSDQLRWDSEQRNTRKAARSAGSLLAALGASLFRGTE